MSDELADELRDQVRDRLARLDSMLADEANPARYEDSLLLIDDIRRLRSPPPAIDLRGDEWGPARIAYAVDTGRLERATRRAVGQHLSRVEESLRWWLERYCLDMTRPEPLRRIVKAYLDGEDEEASPAIAAPASRGFAGRFEIEGVPSDGPGGRPDSRQSSPAQGSGSRFLRLAAGSIGFALFLGLSTGFTTVFVQSEAGQRTGAWLGWGALGLLKLAAIALGLCVIAILALVAYGFVYNRLSGAKRKRK